MILSDCDLKNLIKSNRLVIEPLADDTIQQNGIDFKMANELAMSAPPTGTEIMDCTSNEGIKKFYHIVKSNDSHFVFSRLQHYLLTTKENIKMPNDLMGFCGLRSTFARLGFVSPLTMIDAGFEGTLTIGVFYGGNNPIRVPEGCRFLHVVFGQLMNKADSPYRGKYRNQKGISLPRALV